MSTSSISTGTDVDLDYCSQCLNCSFVLKDSASREASEGGTLPRDKKKKRGFSIFHSLGKKKDKDREMK